MYDLNKLRNEYATLHTETGNILSAAHKEGRELTGEERQNNDRRYARMDSIRKMESAAKQFAAAALDAGRVEVPKPPAGRDEYEQNAGRQDFATKSFDADAYKVALNKYATTGEMSRSLF